MINTEDETSNRTAKWSEIPELQGHDSFKVTDIWTGSSLGCIKDEYAAQVESHDTAGLFVTGGC
jgi:alpha-galactosidase